jgi:hypothetical protein
MPAPCSPPTPQLAHGDSQAGPAHIEALLAVLKAVTKEETCQYVLALLTQMLLGENMGAHACML